MKPHASRATLLALGLIALFAVPLFAASTANAGTETYTTITALPFVIRTPGAYRIAANLEAPSTGNAIEVVCDNVALDLDGYTISTPNGSNTCAVRSFGRNNVTVRNGKLRGGWIGVELRNGVGLVVEDLTVVGALVRGIGILEGVGGIVRRCSVLSTGYAVKVAIKMSGRTAVVRDNVIAGGTLGVMTGIDMNACEHAIVEGNVISNEFAYLVSNTYGILSNGNYIVVTGNRISNFETGIRFSSTSVGALYRDNVVDPCFVKYFNGTDGGNNF